MDRFGPVATPAKSAVLPGESLRWEGRAPMGLRLRASDALSIPFSLLWCGFAIFWESAAIASHAPLFFRLWGLPFVAVGLFLVAGRFFTDAWLRGRTSYAVTDRAAYVVRTAPFAAVRRHTGSALDAMTYEPRADGSGTIHFATPQPRGRSRGSWTGGSLDAFEGVPNVAAVAESIGRIGRS